MWFGMMTLQTANELNVEPNEQFDRNKVKVNLKEEKSQPTEEEKSQWNQYFINILCI